MEIRPITPVTLLLINGEERNFILSMGDLKRLMERFKVERLDKLFTLGDMVIAVPVLFAALREKGDMTEEGLADLLPSHIQVLGQAVATLLGVSFPDPTKSPDPIRPTPAIQ